MDLNVSPSSDHVIVLPFGLMRYCLSPELSNFASPDTLPLLTLADHTVKSVPGSTDSTLRLVDCLLKLCTKMSWNMIFVLIISELW